MSAVAPIASVILASALASPAGLAQWDARTLSADPNVPRTGAELRGGLLRGSGGSSIALFGDPGVPGFGVVLSGMVELHNEVPGSNVPFQLWRGLVSVELARRFEASGARRPLFAEVSFGLFHESDHATQDTRIEFSPEGQYVPVLQRGFLNLNGADAHLAVTGLLGNHAMTVRVLPKMHLLTCTRDELVCAFGGGSAGTGTFEAALEVVDDFGAAPPAPGEWRGFISLYADAMAASPMSHDERRFAVSAGAYVRTKRRGHFQLAVSVLAGNEVGLLRAEEGVWPSVWFRWAL